MTNIPYNMLNPNKNYFSFEQFKNNTVIDDDKNNQFIVNNTKLTKICPHNGCKLNYNISKKQFICPCHASTFNLKGDCLKGPACPNNIRL